MLKRVMYTGVNGEGWFDLEEGNCNEVKWSLSGQNHGKI